MRVVEFGLWGLHRALCGFASRGLAGSGFQCFGSYFGFRVSGALRLVRPLLFVLCMLSVCSCVRRDREVSITSFRGMLKGRRASYCRGSPKMVVSLGGGCLTGFPKIGGTLVWGSL